MLAAILCIALLVGIGIPVYTKVTGSAREVAAEENLETAEKAVDAVITDDPSVSQERAYDKLSVPLMKSYEPKVKWAGLTPGTSLPEYGGLTPAQRKSVFLVKRGNPSDIWVFVVSGDGRMLYAHGRGGEWVEEKTVPYASGIKGVIATGG